ncbi:MAG TPA: response regulator [Rhizomicrobium sp.]|nr:response regulator [Rhizomicrobium sp.]
MLGGSKGTIYVVDDDLPVRDSLRALLETCGYEVKVYSDGEDFLRNADASGADCLLVDMDMPRVGGRQLLERLRDAGITTPAIVLTTNGKRMGPRWERAQVFAVISKPVASDELLRLLDRICC